MTGSQIMASFIECLYFKCTRKFTTWVTMAQNHLTLVSGDLTPLLTLKGGKKLGRREISVAKALALQVEQSAGPQNPFNARACGGPPGIPASAGRDEIHRAGWLARTVLEREPAS